MNTKEVFRRYQDALRKPDMLDELLTADFVAHDLPPPNGRDALIAFREAVTRATADEKFTISDLVAEGDRVAARMTSESTHTGEFAGIPPTGKRIKFEIYEIVRVADGRIAERWVATNPSVAELMQYLRG